MKTFINNAINELSGDKDINKHSLIKVLIESIDNTIKMGGSISSAYNNLKKGLVDINEHLRNEKIAGIIDQFNKFEETDENRLFELYKEADLNKEIKKIKNSGAYADPVIMHKTDMLEETLYTKNVPEFKCYSGFVKTFTPHMYNNVIKESVEKISNYVNNNLEKILVIDSIYEMNRGGGSKLYLNEIDKLTGMLLNESYSSEAVRIKLNSDLPVLHKLVENLAMYESSREKGFSIGAGNTSCVVRDTIVPSTKLNKNTMLFYMDDKFLSIANNNKDKQGNVLSECTKTYVSEIDPTYVKENNADFYNLCESFYNLKFTNNESGNGILSDSIRNFVLEFKVEEKGTIGTYLNDTKVEFDKVNFSEVLLMESTKIKNNVSNVLKGSESIFNFEFIKLLENKTTGKETYIIEANGDYHVCEKLNSVEREWKDGIDEYKLYNYVLENFNYDISPIFKVKIDKTVATLKEIEDNKQVININVSKLEESVKKIDDNLSSGEIDDKYHGELENIKHQLENKILSLREKYVEIDLKKKELAT